MTDIEKKLKNELYNANERLKVLQYVVAHLAIYLKGSEYLLDLLTLPELKKNLPKDLSDSFISEFSKKLLPR